MVGWELIRTSRLMTRSVLLVVVGGEVREGVLRGWDGILVVLVDIVVRTRHEASGPSLLSYSSSRQFEGLGGVQYHVFCLISLCGSRSSVQDKWVCAAF